MYVPICTPCSDAASCRMWTPVSLQWKTFPLSDGIWFVNGSLYDFLSRWTIAPEDMMIWLRIILYRSIGLNPEDWQIMAMCNRKFTLKACDRFCFGCTLYIHGVPISYQCKIQPECNATSFSPMLTFRQMRLQFCTFTSSRHLGSEEPISTVTKPNREN